MERENSQDHERLEAELEHDAAALEQQADRLDERIEGVRDDWERKRADADVPGARPRSEDELEEAEERGPSEPEPQADSGQ